MGLAEPCSFDMSCDFPNHPGNLGDLWSGFDTDMTVYSQTSPTQHHSFCLSSHSTTLTRPEPSPETYAPEQTAGEHDGRFSEIHSLVQSRQICKAGMLISLPRKHGGELKHKAKVDHI